MIVELEQKLLSKFFFMAATHTTESKLQFKPDGLVLITVDAANVCMLALKIKTVISENMELGIDHNKFKDTIDALKSKMVSIDFKNITKVTGGKISREILSLSIETMRKIPNPPSIDLPVKVRIPAEDVINIITAIESDKPEAVLLDYNNKKFTIISVSDNPYRSEFDIISVEKGGVEHYVSKFSFDYIKDIIKSIKKSEVDDVFIQIGKDSPVIIDVESDALKARWILAPRVDTQ